MLAGLLVTVYYMLSNLHAVHEYLPQGLAAHSLWWGIQPVAAGVFGVPVGVVVIVLVSCWEGAAKRRLARGSAGAQTR